MKRPVRPDLPAAAQDPGPTDLSVTANAKLLRDISSENTEIVKWVQDTTEKVERRTALWEQELAAICSSSITSDAWPGLTEEAEKLIAVVKAVIHEGRSDERFASVTPNEEVLHETQTPDALVEERSDYSKKLERIAELEAEVTGLLKQKTAEADSLVEQLRAKTQESEMVSWSLQEKTAKADDLVKQLQTATQLLQQKTTQADELSVDLEAKTKDFESVSSALDTEKTRSYELSTHLQGVRDEVKNLSSHLSERDRIITKLQDELLGKDAAVESKSAQVESLHETVTAIFNSMTSKHLDIVQWLEIWDALEEHPVKCEPVNIPIWTFDQSLAANIYNLDVRGISTVCMHLIATFRAGKWDNEAMCLMNLLMTELEGISHLPVRALLLLLSVAIESAPAIGDNILLLSIWQMAHRLELAFKSKHRFAEKRTELDEVLPPWCQRIARAIQDDTVMEMCAAEDGQTWEDRGLAVLVTPEKGRFVAFDISRTPCLWNTPPLVRLANLGP